jgi:hypothetical protein
MRPDESLENTDQTVAGEILRRLDQIQSKITQGKLIPIVVALIGAVASLLGAYWGTRLAPKQTISVAFAQSTSDFLLRSVTLVRQIDDQVEAECLSPGGSNEEFAPLESRLKELYGSISDARDLRLADGAFLDHLESYQNSVALALSDLKFPTESAADRNRICIELQRKAEETRGAIRNETRSVVR